jgi:hypothetical protein
MKDIVISIAFVVAATALLISVWEVIEVWRFML